MNRTKIFERMSTVLGLTALLLSLNAAAAVAPAPAPSKPAAGFHQATDWEIKPSQAFDALCLLNTLTADSFYLDYYKDEYAKFAPQLTPAAISALADLKHKVKDSAHGIISASMCLFFSATPDSTLDDLLATVRESSGMQRSLKLTTYYSEDDWALYQSIRGDLDTIFVFLQKIKFEEYWLKNVLPKEQKKIAEIDSAISKYNVIPEVESLLGTPLASNRITVFMLYYSQPHGIKIVGTRFLTDQAWPFTIVVRNAVHEMMHPPYQLEGNKALADAMARLKKDDFLMDKVLHHDPSYGYNSFEGYFEEDCVQALDQSINEKIGVAIEARKRWKISDDGMHVLAVALYQVMKSQKYNQGREKFADFLIRMITGGELAPGKIKPLYEAFYAGSSK